jgi:hypothetical protein
MASITAPSLPVIVISVAVSRATSFFARSSRY